MPAGDWRWLPAGTTALRAQGPWPATDRPRRGMAGEFPEFAFWAHRVGVQAILGELGAARSAATQLQDSLQAVTALLAAAARGPGPV
jgi:hypothetical protein